MDAALQNSIARDLWLGIMFYTVILPSVVGVVGLVMFFGSLIGNAKERKKPK